jgi:hypothetical protein
MATTRRLIKLPTPQGVGASQTATVRIPLGPTYDHLFLELMNSVSEFSPADVFPMTAARMADSIGEIRLIVDGDTKIRGSAAFFLARAQLYGQPFVAGSLPLFLASPWARTMGGEESTAYGTAGGTMATFTLEVDFKAAAIMPSMQVYSRQSAPKPFANHLRIQPYADSFGFVGPHEMSGIPALGPHRLLALDITSGDIGDVEVLADNVQQYYSSPIVRKLMLKLAKRNPVTGYTHIDFIPENRMDESMPLALSDFRVKLNFTEAPEAFTIYATTLQNDAIR